jgi:hypothetical protein
MAVLIRKIGNRVQVYELVSQVDLKDKWINGIRYPARTVNVDYETRTWDFAPSRRGDKPALCAPGTARIVA